MRGAVVGVLAALAAASWLTAARAEAAPHDAGAHDAGALEGAGAPAAKKRDTAAKRSAAAAAFAGAEQAARDLRFAEALAAYREAAAVDPSAPFAPIARTRATDLEAHAEGAFAPLARLEEVRRDPRKSSDRAAIEALERDAAQFPPGRVRAEARLVIAEAWWHALGDPARAIAPLEAAIDDRGADRLTRSLALAELVAVLRAQGDVEAARRAVLREPDLSPGLRVEVLRVARRARIRWASVGVLALLAIIGALALTRAVRMAGDVRDVTPKVVRPLAVAFSLYLGGAASIVVRLRGDGDARPFLWLGLGVLAVDVIARTWRLAWTGGATLRALACVAGVGAVAFLAIERTDAGYLESFGL